MFWFWLHVLQVKFVAFSIGEVADRLILPDVVET